MITTFNISNFLYYYRMATDLIEIFPGLLKLNFYVVFRQNETLGEK